MGAVSAKRNCNDGLSQLVNLLTLAVLSPDPDMPRISITYLIRLSVFIKGKPSPSEAHKRDLSDERRAPFRPLRRVRPRLGGLVPRAGYGPIGHWVKSEFAVERHCPAAQDL